METSSTRGISQTGLKRHVIGVARMQIMPDNTSVRVHGVRGPVSFFQEDQSQVAAANILE